MSMPSRKLVSMAAVMAMRAVFHWIFWSLWMTTVPNAVPMNSGSSRTIGPKGWVKRRKK